MSDPSDELPAKWHVVPDSEVMAEYVNHSLGFTVVINQESVAEYTVLIRQRIFFDGKSTCLTTHGASFESFEVARARAIDFMTEISDGEHTVSVLGVIRTRKGYDVVAVFDDEVPEGTDVESIAETVMPALRADNSSTDSDSTDSDASGIDGEEFDVAPDVPKTMTVDVYPKLDTHVESTSDYLDRIDADIDRPDSPAPMYGGDDPA